MLSGDAMRSSVVWKLPVNPFQDQKYQLLSFRTMLSLWAQRQASNRQTVLWTFAAGMAVEEGSGYRIVAVSAPGMAAEDAAHGKVEAFEGAMLAECLKGVLRASWGKTT